MFIHFPLSIDGSRRKSDWDVYPAGLDCDLKDDMFAMLKTNTGAMSQHSIAGICASESYEPINGVVATVMD